MRLMQSVLVALCLPLSSTAVFAADVTGNAEAGAKKVSHCQGCHGIPNYQASFPEVYRVPKLGGQSEQYLISALNDYRKGDRKHPTMHATALALSDQDIADIASYYAQAKGGRP